MSEPFDPYRIWLGIPADQQPPSHYQLLGVVEFESDPDVLENAADRQMAHVRTFQSGKHSEESQRILNEITQAKLCLLKPDKRAAYEAKLKAQKPVSAQVTGERAIPVSASPTAHPAMNPMTPTAGTAIPVGSAQQRAIPVSPVRPAEHAIKVTADNPTAHLPGVARPNAKSVTRRARRRRGNAGIPWVLIMGVMIGVGSVIAIGMIILKATGADGE
ncbi:MAG: hypothetical protein CMM03_06575 [Rhodopirellula sp.]|nr:hypothetical protein [Rhodopirellula sp.]